MKTQERINSNTKQFDKIKPKGSRNGLKGLLCFLLVLLFMAVSTVSLIFGAYLNSLSYDNDKNVQSPSAVNGTVDNYQTFIDTQTMVQVCIYNQDIYRIASGIAISENGYILTCDHLFKDIPSAQIIVVIASGEVLRGVYVGGDNRTDIAVVKVEQRNMKYVELDPSVKVNVGESIFVGNCSESESGSPALIKGVLSSSSERVSIHTEYPIMMLIIDAYVNFGASGGALLKSKGELIGMVTAGSNSDGKNYGYAVGVDVISSVIDDIINNGCVQRQIKLGFYFEFIGPARAKMIGVVSGLNIKQVSKESDLFQFGFEEGDTITHINGKAILNENDFYDVVESSLDNLTVNLTIRRSNGEERNVDINLMTEKGRNNYLP